jgi:ABC-type glycerol-3-phosphate transport system substrate-binding protein
MTRRDFLRLATIAGAGAGLAACAPALTQAPATQAPATSAPATSGPKEKVTLSLWTHDALYPTFFLARAEEWKANHPQYEFTFDFQQVGDVFTKVLANLAAGEFIPDLLGLEQSWFPNFMKDDIIEQKFVDLTPRIGAERSKFVEATWGRYLHKDKIYGVESALCASVLYYQPELLEQNDYALPEYWDDLLSTGEQLAKKGVAFGLIDTESDFVFTVLFQQRGGQYFAPDGTFVLTEEPNRSIMQEVLNFYREGIERKFLYPVSAADFWGAAAFAAFRDGKVASIAMPDWYSDAVLKANAADMEGKWKVAPMPRWKGGGARTGTWGGTGFGIYQGSPHVDLAWDLLHYTYMTQENQVKRFLEIKYTPTMYDALKDPAFSGANDAFYGGSSLGASLAEVANETPVWYQSPVRRDMIEALGVALAEFSTGKIDAERAITDVANKTNAAMDALG